MNGQIQNKHCFTFDGYVFTITPKETPTQSDSYLFFICHYMIDCAWT